MWTGTPLLPSSQLRDLSSMRSSAQTTATGDRCLPLQHMTLAPGSLTVRARRQGLLPVRRRHLLRPDGQVNTDPGLRCRLRFGLCAVRGSPMTGTAIVVAARLAVCYESAFVRRPAAGVLCVLNPALEKNLYHLFCHCDLDDQDSCGPNLSQILQKFRPHADVATVLFQASGSADRVHSRGCRWIGDAASGERAGHGLLHTESSRSP